MKSQHLIRAGIAGALLTSPLALLANTEPTTAEASPHSISANLGVVSNYIWRGVTQTDDGPAVQGGLDYSHSSGFYAGVWASNVDFNDDDAPNYELDGYLGFGGTIIPNLDYNLKAIYYAYPDADGAFKDYDFSELGGNLTYMGFTLGLDYTIWSELNEDVPFAQGDIYYHAGFEYGDLPFGLGLGLRVGYYDFRHDDPAAMGESADYWNWGLSISKEAGDFGTFSLNYDQNDGADEAYQLDDDPKVWVGWLKEF